MIFTSSGKEVLVGFQPSNVRALVGSPNNCSTSAGRKYLGSTSTRTFPSIHQYLSHPPSPSQRSSIPTSLKANVVNSRTVWYSPVAITKSSEYHAEGSATYTQHSPWRIPSHEVSSGFPNKVCPESLAQYGQRLT